MFLKIRAHILSNSGCKTNVVAATSVVLQLHHAVAAATLRFMPSVLLADPRRTKRTNRPARQQNTLFALAKNTSHTCTPLNRRWKRPDACPFLRATGPHMSPNKNLRKRRRHILRTVSQVQSNDRPATSTAKALWVQRTQKRWVRCGCRRSMLLWLWRGCEVWLFIPTEIVNSSRYKLSTRSHVRCPLCQSRTPT